MFTQEEKELIVKVFSQISVNAVDPGASQTIALIQSILGKIAPEDKSDGKI